MEPYIVIDAVVRRIIIPAERTRPASAPISTFFFVLGLVWIVGTSPSSIIFGGVTSILSPIKSADVFASVSAIFFAISGSLSIAGTRLTHTLEVSQNARTIGKALRLNEDLVEAIALGHDLGHTPFGHAGERALNNVCPCGFKHNEQSVRVVEVLEKQGEGLYSASIRELFMMI